MSLPARGRGQAWPHVAIFLAALPYAQRFADDLLPCSDDGLPHLLRAVEFDLNLRGGAPFLQWSPDLLHGYGYPLFLFYAPGTTWFLELLRLLGLDFAPALRLAYFLCLLIAGWGAYHLIKKDFGEMGGLVGAVAYMYAPYLAFDAIQRGALPELAALALAPWVLWAARKSQIPRAKSQTGPGAQTGSRVWFMVAAVLLAAMMLTHNMIPLLLMPFIPVYAVLTIRLFVSNSLTRSLIIILLALAFTAFFWLPAQQELKFAQTWRGLAVHNQDYRNNLLPLDQWATLPPLPVDLALLNPPIVRTMGIVQLAASLIGLATLPWQTPPRRRAIAFFALIGGFFFFLTTGASRPIWDTVPGMQWLQLPTRFLGLASLGAAGLTGAAGAFILQITGHLPHPCSHPQSSPDPRPSPEGGGGGGECGQRHEDTKAAQGFFVSFVSLGLRGKLSDGLMTALVIAPILGGLPWLYALNCPTPIAPGAREIAAATDLPLRTTAEGSLEFLPIWASEVPDTSSFAAEYAADRIPMRLDTSQAPFPVRVERVSSIPGAEAWQVNSTAGWHAVYRTFYFPGWTATLDGQAAKIEIAAPDGLMAVDIPPGAHRLGFEFHRTPIRVWTFVFSGMAWAVVMGFLLVRTTTDLRNQRIGSRIAHHVSSRTAFRPVPAGRITLPTPRRPHFRRGVVHVLLLTLFAFKLFYLDRANNLIHASRLDSGQLAGVAHPTGIDFGGELRHLGYDLSREFVPSGGRVTATQYWTATAKIGVPYGMAVRIADDAGRVWSAPDPPRPFGYADYPGTESWPPGRFARDAFILDVLPGTPPGTYWLEANAFRRDVVASLLPAGASVGVDPAFARIGKIEITPGRGAPPVESWHVTHTGETPLANWLTLKGWTISPDSATVGEYFYLDLLWNAPTKPGRNVKSSVEVRLKDGNGRSILSEPVPLSLNYPPGAWPAGAWVRTQARVLLPAHLPGGTYRVILLSEEGTIAKVGEITIATPRRIFEPPSFSSPFGAAFGDIARLAGFNLSAPSVAPGETLRATLVWQSIAETPTSFRVFAHLRAADGAIVAQSDGVPANWARPTTGWLAGEFIADERAIALPPDAPPGEYQLVVGLYDPVTNVRLPASTGGDEALLTLFTVHR